MIGDIIEAICDVAVSIIDSPANVIKVILLFGLVTFICLGIYFLFN